MKLPLLILSTLFIQVVFSSNPPENCVWFYHNKDYSGSKSESCSYDSKVTTNGNKWSSVKLGSKVDAVDVYNGYNYSGTHRTITKNTKDLGDYQIDNQISSYVIQHTIPDGCVMLYRGSKFTGSKRTYCGSIEDLGSKFDNKISSIRVGPKVDYFQYFAGKNYDDNSDNRTLYEGDVVYSLSSLNDRITSFVIAAEPPENCVWFYEHKYYGGNRYEQCYSTRQVSGNDKWTSMKVGYGIKQIRLYKDSDYQGSQYTQTKDRTDFNDFGANDKISSVIITHFELPAKCVWMHHNANYGGSKREYCESTPKISPSDQDKFSSITFGSNVRIMTIHKGDNYKNNAGANVGYIIYNSSSDLQYVYGGEYNNEIQSFQIQYYDD